MLLLLLQAIPMALALYQKNYYRTRGLNVITLDLNHFDELSQGSTTLNIILDNNSQTSYPYLSFCYTDNQQTIKNVLGSISSIEAHIESNKKQCVFDNNALLLAQEIQQIVLVDYIDSNDEWAYNKFSVYRTDKQLLSFYIYSNDDSQYSITIKGSAKGECYNSCNNHGTCYQGGPSFCGCDLGYLDSTCQDRTTVVSVPSLVQVNLKLNQFEMPSLISNLFTIPLGTIVQDLQIDLSSSSEIIAYLTCYKDKDYIPFFQSNGFNETSLQSGGSLILTKSQINDCLDQNTNVKFIIGQIIQPSANLLLVNTQPFSNQVQLKIYLGDSGQDTSGLQIYYILAGALGALMVALLIIICLIYFQRRARRVENQIGLQSQRTGKVAKAEISLRYDYIPVELYEQILQEYPGLSEISECQICLIEFQKQDLVKLTYCLHLFHAACLDQWRKRNQTCPFCREDLTKQKYIQHKQEELIYKLGVVSDDQMHIDEQKADEIQKRENRLKQLKETSSPATVNVITLKENSPSPYSGDPILLKLFKQQQK